MSDYPTDDEVDKIRAWTFTAPGSFEAFMEYVKSVGHYWPQDMFGWHQYGRTFHVSTGGWSGNEEILSAMQNNLVFWMVCWKEHTSGGHYVFELPNSATYWATEVVPL